VKVGFWNYYEGLNINNLMFKSPHVHLGDDLLMPLNKLYNCAREKGLELMTLDMIADFESIDAFVFMDFPNRKNRLVQKAFASPVPKYFIILESEVIKSDNWDLTNHKYFKKIFTWNDTIIDNIKYFKINIPQQFPVEINKNIGKKRKLCTLMAGRKRAKHPLEIYTKRLEAIRWFERNHSNDFDLYGIGWDGYKVISRKWSRMINSKAPYLAKYLPLRFPSFRGYIEAKRPVLEQYKFAICYENARDIPGYITEKIFDCFFAGCVPVYWGANNVTDHIPEDCFIDKRKYKTYEALYNYMNTMRENEYLYYLDAIESFILSSRAYQFSSDYFTETVLREITHES